MSLRKRLWKDVLREEPDCSLPCPITGSPIPCSEYHEMYHQVLDQFDELMFDDYFIIGPNNPFTYEFTDTDAKDNFVEWLQDEGIMDDWKTIQEGWGSKQERKEHKKRLDTETRKRKIVAQLRVSIRKLEIELDQGKCKSVRKAEMKLEKMRKRLSELN